MSIQTFTAAQVLTAAQMNTLQANDYNQTVSTKTGSYTLVAADKGTRVVMNVASANTVTVNTSLFSAGDTLVIQNIGAGVTTVTAGTATVSSAGPLTIAQYGSGTLYFTSAGVSLWFPSAGPTASSGLTFIGSVTTSGASVTLSNCFSATYRNYLVIGDSIIGASDGYGMYARFGVSGTPTTTGYTRSSYGAAQTSVTEIDLATYTTPQGFTMNVFAPNAATTTLYITQSVRYNEIGMQITGRQTGTSQFTDLQIYLQGGSTDFTGGTVRVYGYANS